jgi:hypothetical protein
MTAVDTAGPTLRSDPVGRGSACVAVNVGRRHSSEVWS